MSSTTKFEKILLSLLIFLIPSNLAFHFTSLAQLVDGVLVDYLIPRLYLNDVLIVALLGISFVNRKSKILNQAKKIIRSSPKSVLNPQLAIVAFFAITLLTSFFAPNPPAAFWFWLKLLEMSLLYLCLKHQLFRTPHLTRSLNYPERASHLFEPEPQSRRPERIWGYVKLQKVEGLNLIYLPLILSVLFQSLLALAQYLKQESVFPYFLLGESQFSATTPGIAKGALFGGLKVLPYGTTPHPNVLAGFLAISLVTLYILRKRARKKSLFLTASNYVTAIFGFSALILTESVSSLGICTLAIVAISYLRYSSNQKVKPLKPLFFLAVAVVLIGVWSFLKTALEPESLSRRLALNQTALRIITDHPLLGVGLNNFTAMLPAYGEVEGPTRFLQPVHNIYLLLASETGLIGFVTVVLLLAKLTVTPQIFRGRKRLNKQSADHRKILWGPFSIPLLMVLVIGLVDHYPLTLQTGQLLLVFSLALATNHTSRG